MAAYSLSGLERYQDCPFKFFAADVLKLEEPPEDEPMLSPRARGRFVHEVFQRFFEAWDALGRGTITADRVDEARRLFEDVAAPLLGRFSDAEALLERARLFGSAASVGIVDVVLGLEASRQAPVRERWLEYRFDGAFSLGASGGSAVPIKGVADRVDLLDGNRLRVIDYKSGARAATEAGVAGTDLRAVCAGAAGGAGRARVDHRRSVLRRVCRQAPAGAGGQAGSRRSRRRSRRGAHPRRRDRRRDRSGANFQPGRTSCGSAATAPTPPCAGRTTLETSDDILARARAVDPRFNVALEASAGTGKTRVLVDRYINLLRAGVDPSNILAITFTRKAAAEMRERIMATLRAAAAAGEIPPARWRELRDRTADITISTIDAFCLSLLREFPLEADLDPAFSVADDTELPRLIDEALDRALRICRALARDDDTVALAFAQLGERRVRIGLTTLLNRRIVAPDVCAKYLAASGAADLDIETVTRRAAASLDRRVRFDARRRRSISRNRSAGARVSAAGARVFGSCALRSTRRPRWTPAPSRRCFRARASTS